MNNKVDLSIIAISGISALNVVTPSIKNSNKIGIVNKESIVSAGKFIINLAKKYKTNIIPLDSEHYSIYSFLKKYNKENYNHIKKIYLTASGGPFLNLNKNNFKNITLQETLKHPTWKMGIKNTIDSATMINKCLEIIEAHYLFNIEYSKLDILINPESLIHSIIEFYDETLIANISNNDMSIPIKGCLTKLDINNINKMDFNKIRRLNLFKPNIKKFNSLKIFKQLDKNSISQIIVFNTSNEYAVNLFINGKINFLDINKIIKKSLNKFEKINISNINEVITYQNFVFKKISGMFN